MLEPHLRSHTHECVQLESVTRRPSPHKCQVPGCGKVFAYRSGLMSHIHSVHDQRMPIRCPEKSCRKSFVSNSQMREHYERVHRNQPQAQLFDAAHLPQTIQSMQLPMITMDNLNRPMISPVQQQQQLLRASQRKHRQKDLAALLQRRHHLCCE